MIILFFALGKLPEGALSSFCLHGSSSLPGREQGRSQVQVMHTFHNQIPASALPSLAPMFALCCWKERAAPLQETLTHLDSWKCFSRSISKDKVVSERVQIRAVTPLKEEQRSQEVRAKINPLICCIFFGLLNMEAAHKGAKVAFTEDHLQATEP